MKEKKTIYHSSDVLWKINKQPKIKDKHIEAQEVSW